jgi:hypothetical protein
VATHAHHYRDLRQAASSGKRRTPSAAKTRAEDETRAGITTEKETATTETERIVISATTATKGTQIKSHIAPVEMTAETLVKTPEDRAERETATAAAHDRVIEPPDVPAPQGPSLPGASGAKTARANEAVHRNHHQDPQRPPLLLRRQRGI